MAMLYRTKGDSAPGGKPRVYFTCHPADVSRAFDRICADIFKTHDCAVYYTEDMTEEIPAEHLETDLGRMNLFVIPVTFRLLTEPNRAMDADFAYAIQAHIPVLPILLEPGIEGLCEKPDKFGRQLFFGPYLPGRLYEVLLKRSLDAALLPSQVRAEAPMPRPAPPPPPPPAPPMMAPGALLVWGNPFSSLLSRLKKTRTAAIETQFRAAAPAAVQPNRWAPVKIMAFSSLDRADREAALLGRDVRQSSSGVFLLVKNEPLQVCLQSADAVIEEPMREFVWNGSYASCDYEIFVPADYDRPQLRLLARIYRKGAALTDLRLILDVRAHEDKTQQELPVEQCRLNSAFLSYSSQDRSRVASCIRGIQLARPDMDLFFDVVSLRRGEQWEPRIYEEIDRRDLFYLFWSRSAAASEWVQKELEYALQHKGTAGIEPVPLEPPTICPPPASLQDRHFNDWLLKFEQPE